MGSGSNVTVPFALTVKVPSLGTTRVVAVHELESDSDAHNLNELVTTGAIDEKVSLEKGV